MSARPKAAARPRTTPSPRPWAAVAAALETRDSVAAAVAEFLAGRIDEAQFHACVEAASERTHDQMRTPRPTDRPRRS
jgi:hypothetical protein